MRVLVIGGTRFVGPHVVRGLHAAGAEVAVFHRGQTVAALPDGVREILGDRGALGDAGSREVAALRGFAPEVVVDLIAMTEVDALATVGAFEGVATRLVVASSMDVYRAYSRLHRKEVGEPLEAPFDEEGPLRDLRYPYRGEHFPAAVGFDTEQYEKLDVERVVLGASTAGASGGIAGTVLRLPAVYGAHDANHRLFDPLRRMDDGRPVIALPATYAAWRWTQGYVENVAHAMVVAALDARAAGRVYNVGPMETPTVRERIEALGEAVGWDGELVVLPDEALPPVAAGTIDVRHHLECDMSRIRHELGYEEPVSMIEGLRRTAAWQRAHPPEGARPPDYGAEDAAIATWQA